MNEYKTVADVIPSAFTGAGIFSAFENPVWCYDFNAEALDIQFITTFGERLANPYLLHFDGVGGISSDDLQSIAAHIYAIHKQQWEHLYKAVTSEYNPIHNVDAHEEIIDDGANNTSIIGAENTGHTSVHNNTGDDILDSTNNISDINAGSGDTDSTGNGMSDTDKSAFNSGLVTDTGNDSNTDAVTGTTSENANITNDIRYDEHNITNNDNNVDGDTRDHSTMQNSTNYNSHTVLRYGNIGVTTSAQMINGEIELWKFNFITRVMVDICDTIALSIY